MELNMNHRTVLSAFFAAAAVLTAGTSHARWMNPNTGRFWTMDSYDGEEEEPKSLHKYAYGQGDAVNSVDPSGHEVEALLAAVSITGILMAQISPVAGQATRAAVPLPALPTSKNGQLLTGLIFAESSSRNY